MRSEENSLETLSGPVRVVVPFRDFDKVRHLVDAWKAQFAKLGRECEFVEVENSNLGDALRQAFDGGEAPLVMLLLPEWPFKPADLKALLEAADTADCVCGVRPGTKRAAWQEKLGGILTLLKRIVFGIPTTSAPEWYGWGPYWQRWRLRIKYGLRVQDPGCGLTLIRKQVLDRCPLQSHGRFALIELLAKANFVGALMTEVKLSRAGDMPVLKTPFAADAGDPGRVFRKPRFNDTSKTKAGAGDPTPAEVVAISEPPPAEPGAGA